MSSAVNKFFSGKCKEDIHTTISNDNEHPFWITQYGKTYADPRYQQIRTKSDVGCMEYILSGTGVINVSNKTHIVTAGDTYLLPQGLDVNYYSDYSNPMEKIWFNFNGPLADSIIRLYSLHKTHVFKGIDTSNMILRMHKIAHCSGIPKKIQDETSKLFLEIVQTLAEHKTTDNVKEMSLHESVRIYIDRHLVENITVQGLSDIFGRSRGYITTAFKKAYNIAPHQYIIQSRLQMASAILASARKSTKAVAEEVGFSDEKDFVRYFKEVYGVTPAKYRDKRIQESMEAQETLQKEIEAQTLREEF